MPIEQLPEELKHAPQAVFDKLNEVIEALNTGGFKPVPPEQYAAFLATEPQATPGSTHSQIAKQIAEAEKNPAKPYG